MVVAPFFMGDAILSRYSISPTGRIGFRHIRTFRMALARTIWKFIVAIKDGLALIALLLFFGGLALLLTSRPSGAGVKDGALILSLDGFISEQPADVDPLSTLMSGAAPVHEYNARDLIDALDAAKDDDRVKMVVLDLDRFMGGGQATLSDIGARIDAVKKAGKPVHAYATLYTNDSYQLAAHATKIWVNPMGGALITPTGGKGLYYGEALAKLGVTTNVYRVGTFKSAVEPYIRNDQSPEAAENAVALYSGLWQAYQDEVAKARPAAQLAALAKDPAGLVEANKGDMAKMAIALKLVDDIADPVTFAAAMNKALEEEPGEYPTDIAGTVLEDYLFDLPVEQSGEPIAVVTIAGTIVDGEAGAGTAGGDTIAVQIYDVAADDGIRALVLRVDSPGGSAFASEQIRIAINAVKAKGKPIIVSMANVAASGGYWVATPADVIFAEPETITGSIGVFGVLPTFEGTAKNLGVSTDGPTLGPLTGQPDLIGGANEDFNRVAQAGVERVYAQFLGITAKARKMDVAKVDTLAQGRVWGGGDARQNGLIDRFGGLDEALAEAAKRAKLGKGEWFPLFYEMEQDFLSALLSGGPSARSPLLYATPRAGVSGQGGDLFAYVRRAQVQQQEAALASLSLLMGTQGVQSLCFECVAARPAPPMTRADAARMGPWLSLIQSAPSAF